MSRRNASRNDEGFLIEFRPVGNAVKVSAVDPATMIEVSIVGALTAGEEMLTRIVVRKLLYVLERSRDASETGA